MKTTFLLLTMVALTATARADIRRGWWCTANCIAQNDIQVQLLGSFDAASETEMLAWKKLNDRCKDAAVGAGYSSEGGFAMVRDAVVIDKDHRRVSVLEGSQSSSNARAGWSASARAGIFRMSAASGFEGDQTESSSYSNEYDVEDSLHLEIQLSSPKDACKPATYDPVDDVPVYQGPLPALG